MLKQRVITACVMMLSFLVLLFLCPWPLFFLCTTMLFIVGAWEWSRLAGLDSRMARAAYLALVVILGGAAFWASSFGSKGSVLAPILVIACFWWACAFFWVRLFPLGESFMRSRAVRMIAGCVVLIPAWLSVSYLIQLNRGALIVLLGLLIVAAVDVGAYFTGRKFGKRKLAPVVSPGKSWEGVWGGLAFAMLVGIVFVSVFGELDLVNLLVIILPAALISVVGDLMESMVKRVRGIKDSGSILPGHGGVLDRIDGLASAIPVFTLAILCSNWTL